MRVAAAGDAGGNVSVWMVTGGFLLWTSSDPENEECKGVKRKYGYRDIRQPADIWMGSCEYDMPKRIRQRSLLDKSFKPSNR